MEELVQEDKVSIARACRIVELDRSMFYYQSVKDDIELEAKLSSYLENKLLCNRGCPEYYKRLRREACPGTISGAYLPQNGSEQAAQKEAQNTQS